MADEIKDNFLTDIYTETKHFFSERLSSPFISSFVISWLISNYQVVIITFSETPINHKLDLLKWYFHTDFLVFYSPHLAIQCWIIFGVIIPALAAYIYVFHYPLLGDKFYIKALSAKISLNNKRVIEEGEAYSSPEKVKELHNYYAGVQADLNNQISELNSKNEALSSIVESLQNQVNEYKQPKLTKEAYKELSSDEFKVIKLLGEVLDSNKAKADESDIMNTLHLSRSNAKLIIERLLKNDYIFASNLSGRTVYELKHRGLNIYTQLK